MADVYAKIQNGNVVNTQMAESTDTFDSNFTWAVITNMNPQPYIGCTYDGSNFTFPQPPPPPEEN